MNFGYDKEVSLNSSPKTDHPMNNDELFKFQTLYCFIKTYPSESIVAFVEADTIKWLFTNPTIMFSYVVSLV